MRKLLIVIMVSAAAASSAHAEPSGKCGGGAFAVSSSGLVICSTNNVYKGSVDARSTGGTGSYVVVDGDSTNQSLPTGCFDGYVAVQTGGGYSGVTYASNGDYVYGPQPQPNPATHPPCT